MKRYIGTFSVITALFPFVAVAHGEPVDINDLADSVADLSGKVALLEGQISGLDSILNNFNRLGLGVMALSVIVGIMVCALLVLWFKQKKGQ
ncbi:MAG: hypothetical protein Q7S28_04390 [bacterium]|nr:hypothetical protein [bacterium]